MVCVCVYWPIKVNKGERESGGIQIVCSGILGVIIALITSSFIHLFVHTHNTLCTPPVHVLQVIV